MIKKSTIIFFFLTYLFFSFSKKNTEDILRYFDNDKDIFNIKSDNSLTTFRAVKDDNGNIVKKSESPTNLFNNRLNRFSTKFNVYSEVKVYCDSNHNYHTRVFKGVSDKNGEATEMTIKSIFKEQKRLDYIFDNNSNLLKLQSYELINDRIIIVKPFKPKIQITNNQKNNERYIPKHKIDTYNFELGLKKQISINKYGKILNEAFYDFYKNDGTFKSPHLSFNYNDKQKLIEKELSGGIKRIYEYKDDLLIKEKWLDSTFITKKYIPFLENKYTYEPNNINWKKRITESYELSESGTKSAFKYSIIEKKKN